MRASRRGDGPVTITHDPVTVTNDQPIHVPISQSRNTYQSDEKVIEAQFREVPTPPSSSRALAPVHGAAQAYDSRTQAALRQHNAARARQRQGLAGRALPGEYSSTLNTLYQFDPAEIERAQLATERARINEEREALAREREASRALVVVPQQPPPPDDLLLGACTIGVGAINAHQSLVRQKIEARAEKAAETAAPEPAAPVAEPYPTRFRADWADTKEPDEQDDDYDGEELEDIYNRQFEREAGNDAYGADETIIDEETGRKFVQPRIPSLLPDMAKLLKEKWRKEAQKTVVVPATRVDVMRKFRTLPKKEPEPEPEPKRGLLYWLFGGPSKNEWR